MGVQGLWQVIQPCARPTNLATLNRKRLAVDASIWIYQFLKAVRDKEGHALRNSHVVGFFRRICKLLWFGIKPVFVFDGGAPALKRATLQGRRRRREGRRDDAVRTAGKLLAVQMQRMAQEEEDRRKARRDGAADEQEQEDLPDVADMVYAEEVLQAPVERAARKDGKKFFRQDQYHLPDLNGSIESMGRPDDPRIMSVEELEEYARQFNSGEDVNLYDFSKIDFDGEFFKSLPPADRYNILNAARLRSRLRLGLSKEQLAVMFPNRMDFSRFQVERVQERNRLTQRLMFEQKMTGLDLTINGGGRIAGEGNREYILVKNDGAEGGYALGVLTQEKDIGQAHKPIDVDALQLRFATKDEDDTTDLEDEDFEDVPIEGMNRLPKPKMRPQRPQQHEDSLFVDQDDDQLMVDEEDDVARAIEMSLKSQHAADNTDEEFVVDDLEDVLAPQWEQKAVAAPKPIASSSGSMVAHIINNRANAAVPKKKDVNDDDSDSDEGDLRTILAAARRSKAAEAAKAPAPAPILPNVKNPFGGPLPFEKLDWRTSIFEKKPPPKSDEQIMNEANAKAAETGGGFQLDFGSQVEEEVERQPDFEGGFEKDPIEDDAPMPLPPWMINDESDIRDKVAQQRLAEEEVNEEDQRLAQDEEFVRRRKRQNDIVEIDSSDDDDIEILEDPPVISAPLVRTRNTGYTFNIPAPSDVVAAKSPARESEEPEETLEPTPVNSVQNNQTGPQEVTKAAPWSPSPEIEFEDVAIPDAQPEIENISGHKSSREKTEEPVFEDVELPQAKTSAEATEPLTGLQIEDSAPQDTPPTPPIAQQERIEGIAPVADPAQGDDDLFGEVEYDEFSDPEDEQLLIQMAEEAEEHARFASELNKKPAHQNQEDYERELRQLRNQQKKDRRDADEVTQIMVTECQALLSLFGIPYITAPMEAEAQCAELVSLGLVDGIVTDDSDTFLFGGTRVYKNMFNSNKLVECYLAADLEKEMSLSREQLISIAHLLGSDYTEGISGIGPVTAIEILSEFPGRDGLSNFKAWWTDIQSNPTAHPKEAEPTAFRRKFRKTNATKLFLPPSFPSPPVYDAYMQPEVDKDPQPFQWGVPDLEGLRRFLMATIGWSPERTDEVLVPVIRDMNRRGVEGTQSNITRYFEGAVGVGAKEAFAPRQRAQGSRRMAAAVDRLRTNTGREALGALDEDGEEVEPVARAGASGTRKRKARAAPVVDDDADMEYDDGNDGDEDIVEQSLQEKGTGRGAKKRATGKRKGKGKA